MSVTIKLDGLMHLFIVLTLFLYAKMDKTSRQFNISITHIIEIMKYISQTLAT